MVKHIKQNNSHFKYARRMNTRLPRENQICVCSNLLQNTPCINWSGYATSSRQETIGIWQWVEGTMPVHSSIRMDSTRKLQSELGSICHKKGEQLVLGKVRLVDDAQLSLCFYLVTSGSACPLCGLNFISCRRVCQKKLLYEVRILNTFI
jgi:hypothetical protein